MKKKKASKAKKAKFIPRFFKKSVPTGVYRADPKKIKELENDIRDIINWLAVFEEEKDLLPNDTRVIRERLYRLANKVGNL